MVDSFRFNLNIWNDVCNFGCWIPQYDGVRQETAGRKNLGELESATSSTPNNWGHLNT